MRVWDNFFLYCVFNQLESESRPADWTTVEPGFGWRKVEPSDNHVNGNNSSKVTDEATGGWMWGLYVNQKELRTTQLRTIVAGG